MSALPLPPNHPLRKFSSLGGLFGYPGQQPDMGMANPAADARLALAAQLLARSQSGQGFGANLGSALIAGREAQMQSQQFNQQQQSADLDRQYRQAQIAQMGMPTQRAPVIVAGKDGKPVYASADQAIGQSPYMEPRGNTQGPSEIEIAQFLNDPSVPEATKKDLRGLLDRKYRDPAGEPLVSVLGPNGQPILVPRSQAVNATPAATRENPSDGERAAANFLGRMDAAEKNLGSYNPSMMDYLAAERWISGGGMSSVAANKVMSEKGGQYYQAAADWVRAKLRKESGAVISPEEMVQEIRTYFPMPGDTPSRIEQKRQARMQATEGMRGMSGRAAPSTATANPEDPLGLR